MPLHLIPILLVLGAVVFIVFTVIARRSRAGKHLADSFTADTPQDAADDLRAARQKARNALPEALDEQEQAALTAEELRRAGGGK